MADDDLDQQPQRQLSPIGLYSHAAEVAERFPQMVGTPEQFKAMLTKGHGVKPDELKWSGYDQAFAGQKRVTKQQLVQHFKSKLPAVQETTLGRDFTNRKSKYAIPEVQRITQQAGDTPGDLALTLENDAPAYHALRARFPELRNDEDWAHTVATDVFGGGSKPHDAPKFQQYTLPGGKNYREVLMHLPKEKTPEYVAAAKHQEDVARRYDEASGALAAAAQKYDIWKNPNHPEIVRLSNERDVRNKEHYAASVALQALADKQPTPYTSSHWNTPNVLAHLRMSDRALPGGEKALHLEELQSDWGQAARKQGLKPEETQELARFRAAPPADFDQRFQTLLEREKAVPHAPYIDSTQKWLDLGLKRLLHEAAKGGYHKVLVTPGEEQARRYDLSKHISKIEHSRLPNIGGGPQRYLVNAYDHQGNGVLKKSGTAEELPDIVGKEVAEKIVNSKKHEGELSGLDLKVGGEGMKVFYDTMLPQALEKLAKKHDPEARVQLHQSKHKIQNKEKQWIAPHTLDITPRMRESILKGQPAYAAGGSVDAPTKAHGGVLVDRALRAARSH